MAENYLITGYWGEPHVTSENDRGINAAIFGAGRLVLPVGEQLRAEYIGNNTVRIYDGKLIDNGAVAGIPAGEYIDLLIPEAGQGMNRNDIIIFQYSQDASTLIEKGVFMVLSGEETSGTATDPALSQEDLLTNEATLDQMALWRVPVSGAAISSPVQLFEVSKNMKNAGVSVVEATSNDGVAYSATVPGVYELYAGLEVTIIPNIASASTAPTLNVNGLGAKNIRLPVSTNTAMLAQPETETYYVDGRPLRLMYDPKFVGKGAWIAVDKQRQSGNDIYGSVPVEKGGTGADNAEEARANLGAAPAGYGLGDSTNRRVNSLDEVTTAGWYSKWFEANELPAGATYGTKAFRVGDFGDANNLEIILPINNSWTDYTVLTNLRRRKSGGVWLDWEWENPNLDVGIEYRTTERYFGKPVYAQLVNFGGLPSATSKGVVVTTPTGLIEQFISRDVQGHLGNTYPAIIEGMRVDVSTFVNDSGSASITITTTHDWYGGQQAYVLVKYTKR